MNIMATRSKQATVLANSSSISNSTFRSSPSGSPLFPYPSLERRASSGSIVVPSQRKTTSHENQHGHVLGWLEAMKASSPRANNLLDEGNFAGSCHDEMVAQYNDWIAKHPSALHMFDKILETAREKQVAVFLDYDGTLSPIVEDPDCAYISEEMRDTVKAVAANFPTAIITGRCRDKVYEFVRLAELYYAGSHGMDIMGPAKPCNGFKANGMKSRDGNDVVFFQPASEYLPLMNEVCEILKERAKNFSGARVEHNKFCITLHFRCVKEESWSALAEEVEAILLNYPALSLTQGRKVLELRPSIEWHKGKALEFLLKSLGLESCTDVLPFYIGDDRTDEDAFNVLQERGLGCSILVSKVAKETCAGYSLQDPSEVMEFLQRLVNWRVLGAEY